MPNIFKQQFLMFSFVENLASDPLCNVSGASECPPVFDQRLVQLRGLELLLLLRKKMSLSVQRLCY